MTEESIKRGFERFTLPVIIEVPGISDVPLVPEDISAGGVFLHRRYPARGKQGIRLYRHDSRS
ncbi:MAG: hypothetical protein HN435_00010 [Nitrospinaceae bacterium]|jgi:hypothetical protein|nr:hypothetical protein [Nitrospinaceae bacterium]MBT5366730.1 hypothetical protein [Nitrospinaceae bacterium]MBT5946890.1 hypothetical protein [Nitrospinaceae bacterium]